MVKNSILEEIHQIRQDYADKFDNNLHYICKDALQKQGQKGRPVVPANPKPVLNQLMRRTNVFDDRREMTDTIKKVVDHPVEECPSCAKIRDED